MNPVNGSDYYEDQPEESVADGLDAMYAAGSTGTALAPLPALEYPMAPIYHRPSRNTRQVARRAEAAFAEEQVNTQLTKMGLIASAELSAMADQISEMTPSAKPRCDFIVNMHAVRVAAIIGRR